MKNPSTWCASAVLSVSLATILAAQTPALDVKMGLWEVTASSQVAGQMPTVDTSKMTPEQKAAVDAAMKGMTGRHTTVNKTCMTPAKLAESAFMDQHAGQTCKQTLTTNTRSALDSTVTCTGPRASTAHLHIDARSSTAVTGTIDVATTDQGRAMTINVAVTGKWLNADCGSQK